MKALHGLDFLITRQANPGGGRIMLEYQKSATAPRIRLASDPGSFDTRYKAVNRLFGFQNLARP